VVVKGKTYRGEELKLQVIPPGEQDLAILEYSTTRETVHPLQPFTIRLTVFLKGAPEPFTERDPTSLGGQPPVLAIPWADDEGLPDGIEPKLPAVEWLQGMLSNSRVTTGFGINQMRVRSDDLFLMFSSQRAVFCPEPRRIKRQDGQGRTVDYWEYTFERTLTATRLGPVSFAPVTLRGTFATRSNPAGGVDGEDVYAATKRLVVEVRGAPLAGRPQSYIGAVGRFTIDSELTPTTAKVGDPMTLTLRIRGEGSLSDAVAPQLDQVPVIADSFKVYQATEKSSADGERQFTYNLRPKKAGVEEFPPIELAYFDFDQEQYVTIRTEPIPISIADADRLAHQEIAVGAPALGPSASAIEASAEGLFANITDPRQVVNARVHPETWFLTLGTMAGAYVVCGLVIRHIQRRRNDPLHQRRRGATRNALHSLAEARRLAAAGASRESLETLCAALIRFVADAIGSADSGLTSRDVVRELASIGVPDELLTRCQQLLDAFDAAKYGDGAHRLEEQIQVAEQVLADLIRELRQRKLAV
jgi:hypothetical protein